MSDPKKFWKGEVGKTIELPLAELEDVEEKELVVSNVDPVSKIVTFMPKVRPTRVMRVDMDFDNEGKEWTFDVPYLTIPEGLEIQPIYPFMGAVKRKLEYNLTRTE